MKGTSDGSELDLQINIMLQSLSHINNLTFHIHSMRQISQHRIALACK